MVVVFVVIVHGHDVGIAPLVVVADAVLFQLLSLMML